MMKTKKFIMIFQQQCLVEIKKTKKLVGNSDATEDNAIIRNLKKVEKPKLVNAEFFSQEGSVRDWALPGRADDYEK